MPEPSEEPQLPPPQWGAMTLGQLRERFKHLPDETIVVGEFEEEFRYNEIGQIIELPAGEFVVVDEPEGTRTPTAQPPVVILYGGQVVNSEYALDVRMDIHLDIPPDDPAALGNEHRTDTNGWCSGCGRQVAPPVTRQEREDDHDPEQ